VSEYGEAGFIRDLPDLNQGRSHHGCSYYEDGEGRKVNIDINYSPLILVQTYLVSGGQNKYFNYLSTTEVLLETGSAWTLTGRLPSRRSGLQAARIDNKIVMTGGQDNSWTYYDEILEFDPHGGQWQLVDRMLKKRAHHAVSVITNFESFC